MNQIKIYTLSFLLAALVCTPLDQDTVAVLQTLFKACPPEENSVNLFTKKVSQVFSKATENLGEGTCGSVRTVSLKPKAVPGVTKVAVKRAAYNKRLEKYDYYYQLAGEVVFLTETQKSPPENLLKFYGCFSSHADTNSPVFYLVMELLEDPFIPTENYFPSPHLHNLLRKPPAEHFLVYSKLADQVDTIHAMGLVINDLKPENMMFRDKESDEPRLIDFGGIAEADTEMPLMSPLPTSYEGMKSGIGTYENDAWAFGFCLAVFEFGYPAVIKDYKRNDNFFGITFDELYWKKFNTVRNVRALLESGAPWMRRPEGEDSFSLLMEDLLAFDPKDRISDFGVIRDRLRALAELPEAQKSYVPIGPDVYPPSRVIKISKSDQEVLDSERLGPERPPSTFLAPKKTFDDDFLSAEPEVDQAKQPVETGRRRKFLIF